jgi:hypothetical protein
MAEFAQLGVADNPQSIGLWEFDCNTFLFQKTKEVNDENLRANLVGQCVSQYFSSLSREPSSF